MRKTKYEEGISEHQAPKKTWRFCTLDRLTDLERARIKVLSRKSYFPCVDWKGRNRCSTIRYSQVLL